MNHTTKWKGLIAAAVLTAGGVGIRHVAQAQADAPPGASQQGADPGGQGGAGGPGRGFGGPGGGFGGPGGGTQLAASGGNVFVTQGGIIYRLDASTLVVKARASLPAPSGGTGASVPLTYGGNGGRSNK